VSGPGADALAQSRSDLGAARLLADGGFPAQAVSRSYYAAFYAAEVVLDALGEVRSKHAAVIAAFDRLVVAPRAVDPDIGRVLRRLFERRNAADYGQPDTPPAVAAAAIADAERFIAAVEAWLHAR